MMKQSYDAISSSSSSSSSGRHHHHHHHDHHPAVIVKALGALVVVGLLVLVVRALLRSEPPLEQYPVRRRQRRCGEDDDEEPELYGQAPAAGPSVVTASQGRTSVTTSTQLSPATQQLLQSVMDRRNERSGRAVYVARRGIAGMPRSRRWRRPVPCAPRVTRRIATKKGNPWTSVCSG